MNDQERKAAAIAQVTARNTLAPALIRELKPEIRSGDKFVLDGGDANATAALSQSTAQEMIDDNVLIGMIIREIGYNIEKGKETAFTGWLLDNEQAMADAAPNGVSYRGTFAVLSASEKRTGDYRTVWAFDSMSSTQNLSAELANAGSEFGRLYRAFLAFRNADSEAESRQEWIPAICAQRIS